MEHRRNSTGLIFRRFAIFFVYFWLYCQFLIWFCPLACMLDLSGNHFTDICTLHAACVFIVLSYFLYQSAAMFSIAASRSTIPDHKWFSAILFVPASEVVPFARAYTNQSFCSHFCPPTYRQLCFANLLLFCLVLFVSFAGGSQNNQSQPKRI